MELVEQRAGGGGEEEGGRELLSSKPTGVPHHHHHLHHHHTSLLMAYNRCLAVLRSGLSCRVAPLVACQRVTGLCVSQYRGTQSAHWQPVDSHTKQGAGRGATDNWDSTWKDGRDRQTDRQTDSNKTEMNAESESWSSPRAGRLQSGGLRLMRIVTTQPKIPPLICQSVPVRRPHATPPPNARPPSSTSPLAVPAPALFPTRGVPQPPGRAELLTSPRASDPCARLPPSPHCIGKLKHQERGGYIYLPHIQLREDRIAL
ncbi:unnamed protein product [Pleuronectes platessa]|uniref:Uncharacterized protein n=1 Tax=Pleuronectes platessa TaxID=8262 RepID=A0A9N7YVM5_PLEPL|nr:unnamed protein product [Pleuronectes platessa]